MSFANHIVLKGRDFNWTLCNALGISLLPKFFPVGIISVFSRFNFRHDIASSSESLSFKKRVVSSAS